MTLHSAIFHSSILTREIAVGLPEADDAAVSKLSEADDGAADET